MRRSIGLVLVGLGVLMLVLAPLSRWYAYPRLAVVPNDVAERVSTGAGVTVLDLGAVVRQDAEVERVTDVRTVRRIIPDQGDSTDDTAVWDTSVTTFDEQGAGATPEENVLSYFEERVAFDRRGGDAVDGFDQYYTPTGERADRVEVDHEGYYFKLPFGTEQRSYPFWDSTIQETRPMEFQSETTLEGLPVYVFEQVIEPTPVSALEIPGALFGQPGSIVADRMYSNTRTIWVEPRTGAIIKGEEQQDSYLDFEGTRGPTIVQGTIEYTRDQVSANVDEFSSTADRLALVRDTIPVAAAAGGLVFVVFGLLLARRGAYTGKRRAPLPDDDLGPGGPGGSGVFARTEEEPVRPRAVTPVPYVAPTVSAAADLRGSRYDTPVDDAAAAPYAEAPRPHTETVRPARVTRAARIDAARADQAARADEAVWSAEGAPAPTAHAPAGAAVWADDSVSDRAAQAAADGAGWADDASSAGPAEELGWADDAGLDQVTRTGHGSPDAHGSPAAHASPAASPASAEGAGWVEDAGWAEDARWADTAAADRTTHAARASSAAESLAETPGERPLEERTAQPLPRRLPQSSAVRPPVGRAQLQAQPGHSLLSQSPPDQPPSPATGDPSTGPAQLDLARLEKARAELARFAQEHPDLAGAGRTEAGRAEPGGIEPGGTEPGRTEAAGPEEAEPSRPEPLTGEAGTAGTASEPAAESTGPASPRPQHAAPESDTSRPATPTQGRRRVRDDDGLFDEFDEDGQSAGSLHRY
ncbi:DUF3068 domain-containing protein [Jiangella anatolica]|uniref:DUF3068 domain-containing protein n=1 Tax=Jiangella anatolica TaxID=2670374 RepID=A0A2W2BV93_9ACTN|nr:DUF3068 domain-containing protein [Jiangella anatolica]PZF84314.1 hypothetical protein C1I92_08780 [Jiangella anatolica]